MLITVEDNCFSSEKAARKSLQEKWAFVMDIDFPALVNNPHWHSFDSCLYLVDGEVTVTDVEANKSVTAKKGSTINFPSRVVHFESTDGYKVVAGMSEKPADLMKVNLDPDKL
ncbi:MAG: cupin domain-containing protein [Gammaproteobacteria bacterium]